MKHKLIIKTWFCACLFLTSLALHPVANAWSLSKLNPFTAKEGVLITVTAPFIELRTGPGRGYPITHVAERHESVRVFKRFTDWYKVETEDGVIGWVKNDELNDSLTEDNYLAVFSRPAFEEYANRKWEIGMAGGEFSGAEALTAYIGYHLTPHISTELKFTQAFGEFSNVKLYSVNAVHQAWPNWRISPFFTLGAGIMQTDPNASLVETVDREDSVLTVGGGFFIYASRNFLIRTEYNSHTGLTSRDENEEVNEWKVGFSVFF